MTTLRMLLSVLLGSVLLLLASPVVAGDEPPPFGASDLALEEEGLLDGWEIVYEDIEGTPGEAIEQWIVRVATGAGLEEDALFTEIRILDGPEDVAATIAVVEVEGDLGGLPKALAQQGKGLGYAVRPLGHPTRLLVVAAPEAVRSKVIDMQVDYAVGILARLAFERLEAGSYVGAQAFARGARVIDAKAGAPLVVLGMVATKESQWDEAIEAFRIGFGKSAQKKAKGRMAMRGYAHYGYACLQKKDVEHDREGRDALEKCVALEENAGPKDPKFIQRYNLGCAHARLNEVDRALEQLEMALQLAKIKFGEHGLQQWVKNTVVPDEDWKNLKDNDRFQALIDKFTGGGEAPDGL